MIFWVAAQYRLRYTERMSLIVCIENHTGHLIRLPPTPTFPKGVRLICGKNSVPKKYIQELEAKENKQETFRGDPLPPRFPGKEALARLQRPVRVVTADGTRISPQISIYDDVAGFEEGPPPPVDLPKDKEAAKAIINVTKDRTALKRWSSDRRADIAAMAANKLAGIV